MSLAPTAHYRAERDVAVIEIDYPPVNALAFELRHALITGLERAVEDPSIRAIVLIGANGVFCGGADLRQLGSPKYWEYPRTIELGQRLDEIDKPVVAALGRLAMGGGLELALGCHYRVSLPQSRLALPEVKLGLMPGGGGTLRLPRLIGIERALQMMLDGEPVEGETALAWGLVDAVARADLLQEALQFARVQAGSGKRPRQARELPVDIDAARASFEAARNRLACGENRGGAPLAIVECTEAAIMRPFDEAVKLTAERTAQRMASDESKGYRHQFFAEREASKVPGEGPGERAAELDLRQVTLVAGDPAQVQSLEMFAAQLRTAGIQTRILDAEGLQSPTGGLPAPGSGNLTMAVISGDGQRAASLLRSLGRTLPEDAPVVVAGRDGKLGRHAAALGKARRVAGLRVPGAESRLIEIVDLDLDDTALLRRSLAQLLKRAGFLPVQTADGPGSVAAALLSRYRTSLGELQQAGLGRDSVGRALTAWGFGKGPLSVDRAWPTDPAPACLQGTSVEKGADAIAAAAPATGPEVNDDASLVQCCLKALADEGQRLVSSGQVLRASDVDVILVAELGFPRFRGGPMFQAAAVTRS